MRAWLSRLSSLEVHSARRPHGARKESGIIWCSRMSDWILARRAEWALRDTMAANGDGIGWGLAGWCAGD